MYGQLNSSQRQVSAAYVDAVRTIMRIRSVYTLTSPLPLQVLLLGGKCVDIY